MKPEDIVTYCGVYCGNCSSWHENGIIVELAHTLLDLVNAHGFHHWMPEEVKAFDYNEFHKGLEFFADKDRLYCKKGCRTSKDGHPGCDIRECVREKGLFICFECNDFPCEIASGSERMLKRAEEYKRLGREEWLKERIKDAENRFEIHTGKCYKIEVRDKE